MQPRKKTIQEIRREEELAELNKDNTYPNAVKARLKEVFSPPEAKARLIGGDSYDDTVKKACGGTVKKYAKGGSVRGDGVAQRGKTRGKMV